MLSISHQTLRLLFTKLYDINLVKGQLHTKFSQFSLNLDIMSLSQQDVNICRPWFTSAKGEVTDCEIYIWILPLTVFCACLHIYYRV